MLAMPPSAALTNWPANYYQRIEAKLDAILSFVNFIARQGQLAMKEMDDLKTQVQANTTVEGSAVQLIQGIAVQIDALKAQLAAAGTNAAELAKVQADAAALSGSLKASADALAAAVAANTTPPASN